MGKSRRELVFAVEAGVSEINVESEPELDTLIEVAELLDARPKITFRVNPDVAAVLGNGAMAALRALEQRFAREIVIEADPGRDRARFQLTPV